MPKSPLKPQLINTLWLIIFPVLYIIAYVVIDHQKGAYYWTINQDPDYFYLMDSLNLLNRTSPGVYQHPGTPLQLLGAAVLIVSYLIQSGLNSAIAPINEAVLSNPELYLELIDYALIGVTGICLLILGAVCYRVSHNLSLSLILQTTPFVMAISIAENEPSRVAPEALLICAGQLLAALLVIYLFKPTVERSLWFAISLGIIFGFGMASKFTFLPMLLFIFLIPGIRQKLIVGVVALFTCLAMTFPVLDKYLKFGNWITAIAIRDGSYGGGNVRLLNLNTILENIQRFLERDILLLQLLIALLISLFGIVLLSKYGKGEFKIDLNQVHTKRLWLLSVLTAIAISLQLFMTMREYYHSRYLVSSVAMAGLIILLVVQLYLPVLLILGRNASDSATLTSFVMTVVLSSAIALGIHQTYTASNLITARSNLIRADLAQIQTLLNTPEYSSCRFTASRRASTIPSALQFAQVWTGRRFRQVLNQLYPQAIFFNEANEQYENYRQRLQLADVLADVLPEEQPCVLLQTSLLRGQRFLKDSDSQLINPVFEGKSQSLYQIRYPVNSSASN